MDHGIRKREDGRGDRFVQNALQVADHLLAFGVAVGEVRKRLGTSASDTVGSDILWAASNSNTRKPTQRRYDVLINS